MIALVARRLKSFRDEIAFLGGASVFLLLTDTAAPETRATVDVDAILPAANIVEYLAALERLHRLGFKEDSSEGAPSCRWLIEGIKVDLMPTDEKLLGFGNRWYPAALAHAEEAQVEDVTIRLVTAPYFLATKIEAFKGRGRNDFLGSRDIEDVIAVVDGRPELAGEIARANAELRRFIANELRKFLRNPRFVDAIAGHLPSDQASQERAPVILARLERMASNG
jgi:hypothetical protein